MISAIVPVSWRGKPAGIAFLRDGVGLASEALTPSLVVFGSYAKTRTTGQDAERTIHFGLSIETVRFRTTADANFFDAELTRIRTQLARQRQEIVLAEGEAMVAGCIYLGGAYLPLVVKNAYDIVARTDRLDVFAVPSNSSSKPVHVFRFSPDLNVDIGGPGEQIKGGRWVGGGFGLVGAIEGVAIASVMNRLTTKRTVTTVITIADRGSEGTFLNTSVTPTDLRTGLSGLFVNLRSRTRRAELSTGSPARGTGGDSDLLSRLERLAALHRSGALNDDEFTKAKAAMLAGS